MSEKNMQKFFRNSTAHFKIEGLNILKSIQIFLILLDQKV